MTLFAVPTVLQASVRQALQPDPFPFIKGTYLCELPLSLCIASAFVMVECTQFTSPLSVSSVAVHSLPLHVCQLLALRFVYANCLGSGDLPQSLCSHRPIYAATHAN